MLSWSTVFVAICIQATPYVVLGAAVAAVLARLPEGWPRRWLPRRNLFAIPVLGLAGTALPGCECGSVPGTAAMIRSGVSTGPAVTFMLSAPAANPVVLAATAAAYPGQPVVVAARFAAGLLTAIGVGTLAACGAAGRPRMRPVAHHHEPTLTGGCGVVLVAGNEILRSLGLLTLGAVGAASAAVLILPELVSAVARHPVLGVVAAAVLAPVMCICSQADAFVARSLAGFSRTAQFAFMVVGAAVDLKVVALQAGAFGLRYSARIGVLALTVAAGTACAVSAAVL